MPEKGELPEKLGACPKSRAEYDPIKHLADALFPFDAKEKLMAYISAYFDESYESPNPRTYTVAGYISTDVRWRKFQKRWKAALEQEIGDRWRVVCGPNKPPSFHMTEFDNPRSKIYGDWPQQKKIDFLKELHKAIHDAVLKGFSTGIIMDDFRRLSEKPAATPAF